MFSKNSKLRAGSSTQYNHRLPITDHRSPAFQGVFFKKDPLAMRLKPLLLRSDFFQPLLVNHSQESVLHSNH